MSAWRKFKGWRRRRKDPTWGRFVLEEWFEPSSGAVVPPGWEFVPLKPRGPYPFNRRGHW